MDEEAKKKFRWTFYGLTIELNLIILMGAVALIMIFLTQIPVRIPVMAGTIIVALVVSWDFSKRFRQTKAWLDEQESKKGEQ